MRDFGSLAVTRKILLGLGLLLDPGGNPARAAVTYSDFPPDLQQVLDQRLAAVRTNSGICLAGRVIFSDGGYIGGGSNVLVNFVRGIDEPLQVFSNGWFIATRPLSLSYSAGGSVVLRAFGFDAVDFPITPIANAITYLDLSMQRTPEVNLGTIEGTVSDENGQPFNGAYVTLSFPFSYRGTSNRPGQTQTLATNGQFSFRRLSPTEYNLSASFAGYAYDSKRLRSPPGGTLLTNLVLFPQRTITVEYVYQPNGRPDLVTGNVLQETVSWKAAGSGVKFSIQALTNSTYDLGLVQTQDLLSFRCVYGNSAFYDAGLVSLGSVKNARATGYIKSGPCQVGHVYVVKTISGNYAKLIVKTDESSFRTVAPGDSTFLRMAGYGLTLSFTGVSGHGQVFVDKRLGLPASFFPGVGLPYYWILSGMSNLTFTTSLAMTYSAQDLQDAGLTERALTIFQSNDHGGTWTLLPTQIDLVNKTVTVERLMNLGWFVLGPVPPPSLRSVHYQQGQFRFVLEGFPEQSYGVETSTNLTAWTPVFTNILADGVAAFLNTNANEPRRFYRGKN